MTWVLGQEGNVEGVEVAPSVSRLAFTGDVSVQTIVQGVQVDLLRNTWLQQSAVQFVPASIDVLGVELGSWGCPGGAGSCERDVDLLRYM